MTGDRYPTYRQTGVEWLGEIPGHWEVNRIAVLFAEVAEQGNDDLPILSVSIHDGVSDRELPPEDMDRKVTRSDDRSKYKRVMRGDLVYNMMRAWQGGFGAVETDGMVSPAYVVARPKGQLAARFTELLLRTPAAIEEMRRRSRGVTDFRLRLYWEEFKGIEVAVPSSTEQGAILAFLERETAKIDALVEEQKRLIDLLKEKRQAVISHAVTKGLNPDVPMKDSGIEWLGKVPEHWEVKALKHLTSHVVDCLHTTPHYDGDVLYPAIRTADLERGRVLLEQARLVSEEVYQERIQRLVPRSGDILYSREGERFGIAALIPDGVDLCLGQRMMMFRILPTNCSAYVMWALNGDGFYQQVLAAAAGATSPHANIGELVNFTIACPNYVEQLQISEHISAETSKIDQLIGVATSAINLLLERRAALISAAVTGKIDVRIAAPARDAAE